MNGTSQQEVMDMIDDLTIIEAVAYTNWLCRRLVHKECTDEEKKNGLELLGRLTDRLRFLKITLDPTFYRNGLRH